MACILSLARFTAPNCPSIHERVYGSSPPPFHININGPSSNYIPKRPRTNNRLNMTTFFSIASVPQLQEKKDQDDSKQTLIERIGNYIDSLVPDGVLQVESPNEDIRIIDLVQILGIQRFFLQQIHCNLESLHSKWDEKYGLTHANLTILGFRLLGFHEYHVTAGPTAPAAPAAASAASINNDHDNSADNSTETKINSINVNEDNNNNTSTSTTSITTTTTTTTTVPAATKEEEEQEQNNQKSLFITHESHPDVRQITD